MVLDARRGCDADRLRGYIERPAIAHHAYRIGAADALEGTYDAALCAHPVVRGLQADAVLVSFPAVALGVAASPALTRDTFGVSRLVAVTAVVG